jgi:aryl-alcohol dehydrogenase-like predicted oxidoreductase
MTSTDMVPQTSHDNIPDDDFRKNIPKYSSANFPKIMQLVSKIKDIGKQHNATAGQISLAFLLAQGDDIIPIPGLVFLCCAREIRMLTRRTEH